MGMNAIGSVSQGTDYAVRTVDQNDQKIKQYGQTLEQLEQNLKQTEKDGSLSNEEKNRKQQEIQAEMEEVSRQKRQAELEVQREERQETQKKVSDSLTGEEDPPETVSVQKAETRNDAGDSEDKSTLLSSGQMESVLIEDHAFKQAERQNTTIQDLENRIRILGGEIRMDQSRGGDVSAKETERDDLQQRVNQARESSANRLGEARQKADEKRNMEQQSQNNYRFIKSQNDVALPNFQISV